MHGEVTPCIIGALSGVSPAIHITKEPQASIAPRPRKPRRAGGISLILFLCSILIFLACALAFLKDLSTQIAVSDASDIVISQVNTSIAEIMKDEDYTGDYFVNFEKTDAGEISAISSNMARINALSAKILDTVINVTENQTITVEIPIGNLTGVSLLMGARPQGSGADNSAHLVKGGIQQQHHHRRNKPDEASGES